MMRSRFDEQLAGLNRELIEMGALCEESIALAAKALEQNDRGLAARIEPLRAEIDRRERTIESLCLRLLLQQQPVARDLRQISAGAVPPVILPNDSLSSLPTHTPTTKSPA